MTTISNTEITDAYNLVNYTDSNNKQFLLRAWQVDVIKLIKKRESLDEFIIKLAKIAHADEENKKGFFIVEMNNIEQSIVAIKKFLGEFGHDVVVSNKEGLVNLDVVACKAPLPVWGWEEELINFIASKKPIEEFLSKTISLFFNNENKKFILINTFDLTRSVANLNNAISSTGYRIVLTTAASNESGYVKLRAV